MGAMFTVGTMKQPPFKACRSVFFLLKLVPLVPTSAFIFILILCFVPYLTFRVYAYRIIDIYFFCSTALTKVTKIVVRSLSPKFIISSWPSLGRISVSLVFAYRSPFDQFLSKINTRYKFWRSRHQIVGGDN